MISSVSGDPGEEGALAVDAFARATAGGVVGHGKLKIGALQILE